MRFSLWREGPELNRPAAVAHPPSVGSAFTSSITRISESAARPRFAYEIDRGRTRTGDSEDLRFLLSCHLSYAVMLSPDALSRSLYLLIRSELTYCFL